MKIEQNDHLQIRCAEPGDTERIVALLLEASRWLQEHGIPMWDPEELAPEGIAASVEAGCFFIAEANRELAGTIKFQLEDELFWPDVPTGESAFLHRFAIRRAFAGGQTSGALLRWAVDRARSGGKRFLRLDCEASRPKLRSVYERFGFRHHSDRQVGPYFVARYEMELSQAKAMHAAA